LKILSVIIPARDEEGCIASTIEHLHLELDLRGVPHEIIVVDDGSTDRTWQILQEEAQRLNVPASSPVSGFTSPPYSPPFTQVSNSGLVATATHLPKGHLTKPRFRPSASDSALPSDTQVSDSSLSPHEPREILRAIRSPGPHGFGRAIVRGLDAMKGDAAVVMMADESDDSRDVVRYWEKLNEGYDCVFGSRFMKGGGTIDYPPIKLYMNRLANAFVRLLFRHGLNDTTNAFKAYRKEVIDGIRPILSPHFNITVELPLKAIVRGYNFAVIPITWRNRRHGVAKLKIREMGSRYLFIVLYIWLEKYFSRGDYRRA
jgi:glycosyltransferase involved in cell wall biosynthesis